MPLRVIAKDSGPRLRVVGLPAGLPKIEFMGAPLYTARTPSPVSITSSDATIVWSGVKVFDKALYKNAALVRYNSESGGTYSFDCADLVIDYDRYADAYLRITSKGSPYTVYAFNLAYCNDSRQVSVSKVYRIDDGTPRNCYVFEDGDEVYYYVLDNAQSGWVTDLSSIGYRLDTPVSIAYVNTAGSEQATVTLAEYASTAAYDKSGQTIPYDASKFYTVTERGALGIWQPNDNMFSLVQNANNNNLEIRNNMTDSRTLAAVKYSIEDNPTAEIWYTQEGGSLANTYYFLGNERARIYFANGHIQSYTYFNDKEIVAWHNGTAWIPNLDTTGKFIISNNNGIAYVRNNGNGRSCSGIMTINNVTRFTRRYASKDKQPREISKSSTVLLYTDNGDFARWATGYRYYNIKGILLSTGQVYTTSPMGTLVGRNGYMYYTPPYDINLIAIFYEAVK